ncbi:MAG: DNA repair protein RadA [Actinomycetota bacterium]
MTRSRPRYSCSECGWTAAKWVGRCGECEAWGTVAQASEPAPRLAPVAPATAARPIAQVPAESSRARPTGVGELDRVLGGGLVPGSVVLLAGEPGVGKSTLALDVAARAARLEGSTVLYLTGEESASQVRLRAERIGAVEDTLLLAAESDLGRVLGHLRDTRPSLAVIDSVQTMSTDQVEGTPGGVSQVRAVAAGLIAHAKANNVPVILIGHVTKDGSIAGPRVLEHLVDVVCQFEGELHSRLRLLRAMKNRYGSTDEVGCFDLTDHGIVELPDPSGLFLEGTGESIPGTCVGISLEGRRPMPAQVQALVAPSALASPRRTNAGLDSARIAMTLAVLLARAGVNVAHHDVYVSTVGGARAYEPAMDLPIALAVAAAAAGTCVAADTVAFGEVGLTGQVRATAGIDRRLAEAARLGFTRAIIPERGSEGVRVPPSMGVVRVDTLLAAIGAGHNSSWQPTHRPPGHNPDTARLRVVAEP